MTTPLYSAHEALAHEVFEALMFALSRPGEVKTLPQEGMAQIIETMIDLDTTVCTLDAGLEADLRFARAIFAPLDQAEHVFVTSADEAETAAPALALGSALYPDMGATLYVPAAHAGTRIKLSGPGIETNTEIETALSPAFWASRAARLAYPEGFEVFVFDGPRVLAISRSTKVEVL